MIGKQLHTYNYCLTFSLFHISNWLGRPSFSLQYWMFSFLKKLLPSRYVGVCIPKFPIITAKFNEIYVWFGHHFNRSIDKLYGGSSWTFLSLLAQNASNNEVANFYRTWRCFIHLYIYACELLNSSFSCVWEHNF